MKPNYTGDTAHTLSFGQTPEQRVDYYVDALDKVLKDIESTRQLVRSRGGQLGGYETRLNQLLVARKSALSASENTKAGETAGALDRLLFESVQLREETNRLIWHGMFTGFRPAQDPAFDIYNTEPAGDCDR